ncbi:MAG: hypothetical protein OSJ74_09375 [Clostridia bacterium]|nr:hypothetical protein [Clostridia bacterium]
MKNNKIEETEKKVASIDQEAIISDFCDSMNDEKLTELKEVLATEKKNIELIRKKIDSDCAEAAKIRKLIKKDVGYLVAYALIGFLFVLSIAGSLFCSVKLFGVEKANSVVIVLHIFFAFAVTVSIFNLGLCIFLFILRNNNRNFNIEKEVEYLQKAEVFLAKIMCMSREIQTVEDGLLDMAQTYGGPEIKARLQGL